MRLRRLVARKSGADTGASPTSRWRTSSSNLATVGLADRPCSTESSPRGRLDFVNELDRALRVLDTADLILNFRYHIHPEVLGRPKRSAMVDIDPGLLQFWLSQGQLTVSAMTGTSRPASTSGAAESRHAASRGRRSDLWWTPSWP